MARFECGTIFNRRINNYIDLVLFNNPLKRRQCPLKLLQCELTSFLDPWICGTRSSDPYIRVTDPDADPYQIFSDF
jgi:hypothetical protein